MRTLLVVMLMLVALANASPEGLAQERSGEWLLRPSWANTVQLTIRDSQSGRRNSTSRNVPISDLQGFSIAMLSGDGPAKFQLADDAGTLDFEGSFQFGSGTGTFRFQPNPAFADELLRLGYSRPGADKLLSLLFLNVDLAFAREIWQFGYDLKIDQLIQFRIHGVNADYIRTLQNAGLNNLTPEQITRLKVHGVD